MEYDSREEKRRGSPADSEPKARTKDMSQKERSSDQKKIKRKEASAMRPLHPIAVAGKEDRPIAMTWKRAVTSNLRPPEQD